ncbi:hypothetical protein G3578_14825 [Brevibacillus sp. SYP-B805]|uniref:hypothetical protein n=1 Tax=Brevibacillus sp. SYP-B805 TaxID=1578199 RepID=UPI0013EC1E35|nr:hypothetical protein [Brevibacillus sp. SYP-B805]NGQ96435.1 hypothetical protein [Brevibacillus sp. SYP-B805]
MRGCLLRERVRGEEDGTATLHSLYFMLCLAGMISLLLLIGQVGYLQMKTQQTADLITKGARAAGAWVHVDPESGEVTKRLFATKQEARRYDADIIRGAREEAEILYELNEPGLQKDVETIVAEHQKGERKSLYRQGIYHLRLQVESNVPLFWEMIELLLERVSQSEV